MDGEYERCDVCLGTVNRNQAARALGLMVCRACAASRLRLNERIVPGTLRVALIPIPDCDELSDEWSLFCVAMDWYPLAGGRRAWASPLDSYVRGARYVVMSNSLNDISRADWDKPHDRPRPEGAEEMVARIARDQFTRLDRNHQWVPYPTDIAYAEDVTVGYGGELPDHLAGTPRGER